MTPAELTPADCRAIRARLGVTRLGLARLLALDPGTLARAERGEGRLAVIYRALLSALGKHCAVGIDHPACVLSRVPLSEWLSPAGDGRSRPRRKA